jgi:hypothetical protein
MNKYLDLCLIILLAFVTANAAEVSQILTPLLEKPCYCLPVTEIHSKHASSLSQFLI